MTADKPGTANQLTQTEAELSPMIGRVTEILGDRIVEHRSFRGDDRIHVAREQIVEVGQILRDDAELAFDLLLDVTAIDYLGQPDDFEKKPEIWDQERPVLRRQACEPPRIGITAARAPSALCRCLSPDVHHPVASPADQMPGAGRRPHNREPHAGLAGSELAGTRNLRPIRYSIHRPSGSPPDLS